MTDVGRVVISAVAFHNGGPLTVLRECLASARRVLPPEIEVHAIVHDSEIVGVGGIIYHEYPKAKSSWLKRIDFEYRQAKRLSAELTPRFWLSLHDASPRLNGEPQAVYCHNPAPFFALSLRDVWLSPVVAIFRLLYWLVYRYNQRANDMLIVQQQWLRERMARHFPASRIIVAKPDVADLLSAGGGRDQPRGRRGLQLLYPTMSRVFKNVETIAEACAQIAASGRNDIELIVTLAGNEDRYATWLFKRFGACPAVRFIGRQDRTEMAALYASSDALLFPSRLETWGLPITEAKAFGLPILAADLPYARETMGDHDQGLFLPATDVPSWRAAIEALSDGEIVTGAVTAAYIPAPLVHGWDNLWQLFGQRHGLLQAPFFVADER